MIAPIPLRVMSVCALAIRCSRSADVIGGGIGIEGVASAASAMSRLKGTVIATAAAPPSIVRRETITLIDPPLRQSPRFP
jgi:hypothetical protein